MKQGIENSKNFCAAPWMHLHIINDGRAYPCCMTEITDEYSVGNIKTEALSEVMNSTKMKSMRKGMIEGLPLPNSCERCKGREDAGFTSMRIGMNANWYNQVHDLVQKTSEDGAIDEVRLLYWDVRFSNYCNLACRTCSPIFSTSWAQDYIRLRAHDDKVETGLINLDNVPEFWSDLDKNLSIAQEIHFAGGEPLLMPEHWKLVEFLEKNEKFDTKLKYSTNATKLQIGNRNILDVWKKFNNVHLSLSIDGIGDMFELTRHKGSWETTKQNLLAIRDSNVEYWIHPTVSILNILDIVELHEELFKLEIIPNYQREAESDISGYAAEDYFIKRFHINPCITPDIYSITNIPEDIKKLAEDKIRIYAQKCESEYGIPTSGWESLINIMNSQPCDMEVFKRFVTTTKKLDKLRKQDFSKVQPAFSKYFENE